MRIDTYGNKKKNRKKVLFVNLVSYVFKAQIIVMSKYIQGSTGNKISPTIELTSFWNNNGFILPRAVMVLVHLGSFTLQSRFGVKELYQQ